MTEPRTQLVALGQSLVDEVFEISKAEIAELGYQPNEQRQISAAEYRALRAKLSKKPSIVATGGAVVNAIYTHAVLGGESTLVTRLGNDANGQICQKELDDSQINKVIVIDSSQPTGTSLIFVDAYGSRAMATCLGAAAALYPQEVSVDSFPNKAAVLIEGYMLGIAGGYALELHRALYRRGHQLGLILAAPWIATQYATALKELLEMSSIVFANEAESAALSGFTAPEQAAEALGRKNRLAIVTAGAQGVWISRGQRATWHVPACEVKVVDTTGAGDSFAGAMMRGLLLGLTAERAARAATYVASVVVSQVGPRLSASVKKTWEKLAFE